MGYLLELYLLRSEAGKLRLDAICPFAPQVRDAVERYVNLMKDKGLILVEPSDDGTDLVALTGKGRDLMTRFFVMTDGTRAFRDARQSGPRLLSSRDRGEQ